jgi:RNA polymerase sigma-70 factor (ECF subfamily)
MRARTRFGITWRRQEVNGQPGALFFDREGNLISVMSLDVAEGQIQSVNSVVNPDKLHHLGPLGDVNALLRERS